LDFRDVHAVDENTAYLLSAGEPAKIYKTLDGGMHWTMQYMNDTPGVFFDAMAFWEKNRGIAFSDPVEGSFLIITTRDGGTTWRRVPPENIPPPLPGEAGFAASGTCVAVQGERSAWFATGGSAARVFCSQDGGWTWTSTKAPIQSGKDSKGIFSIAFLDDQRGVAVGGDYKNPEDRSGCAAWSRDGGKTWNRVMDASPDGYRSCAAYMKTENGFLLVAVGPTGSDYSMDEGKNWTRFSDEGFHSVSFAGPFGWAVGSEGRIARFVGPWGDGSD
jgi:photosystem II stability/assembly factor-like uncharacterized protein